MGAGKLLYPARCSVQHSVVRQTRGADAFPPIAFERDGFKEEHHHLVIEKAHGFRWFVEGILAVVAHTKEHNRAVQNSDGKLAFDGPQLLLRELPADTVTIGIKGDAEAEGP